jgi:hypothetical protein
MAVVDAERDGGVAVPDFDLLDLVAAGLSVFSRLVPPIFRKRFRSDMDPWWFLVLSPCSFLTDAILLFLSVSKVCALRGDEGAPPKRLRGRSFC